MKSLKPGHGMECSCWYCKYSFWVIPLGPTQSLSLSQNSSLLCQVSHLFYFTLTTTTSYNVILHSCVPTHKHVSYREQRFPVSCFQLHPRQLDKCSAHISCSVSALPHSYSKGKNVPNMTVSSGIKDGTMEVQVVENN